MLNVDATAAATCEMWALARRAPRLAAAVARPRCAARAFSGSDGKIPEDINQQAGRRLEEMKYELAGEGELFSRDPIVPPADQGTKENPILVPSAEHERAVGYEDPDAGQLVWFTLTKGPVHYVPDIDLYFKMFPVGDGSGGH